MRKNRGNNKIMRNNRGNDVNNGNKTEKTTELMKNDLTTEK